jgi:hypothetical protein
VNPLDLNPVFGSIGRDDQSWLGSARGVNEAQSVTLLMSAFPAATYAVPGHIPSGIPLSKLNSGANAGLYVPAGTRAVADGATTSGSPTITSATGAFSAADVGASVTGAGIPAGTTIVSVTNATTAVLSANATATATGVSISFLAALAGFLMVSQALPRNVASAVISGPLLDNGRVIVANLPVALPAAVQATNPRFVFV